MKQPSSTECDPSAADPEDFHAFVASRGTPLFRTACLLTGGDTYLAEDLVQETLGRMYAKWGRRGHIENPAGYAQTILVNAFISARRKSSTERSGVEASMAADTAVRDDVPLRLTLLDALRRLSAQDRAVLVLRYWEDRSIDDTAAVLRLSSTAVRSRSMRALAKVRDLLGADFVEFVEN